MAASFGLPIALGIATVYLLIPLDPPDLGWGHTATHVIPAAVLWGVLVLGRRWWPPAHHLADKAVRRWLTWALAATALAQAGEAAAATSGHHDGTGHNVFMMLSALALPLALLALVATSLLCVGRPLIARLSATSSKRLVR